jgi:hypothetical protein
VSQDVIALLFPGNSDELLPRYAEAARRFRDSGGTAPEHIVVAHGEDGLLISLVWGPDVSHELLGRHMLGLLTELGLPFPRVNHATLATDSWDALTASAATTQSSSHPA